MPNNENNVIPPTVTVVRYSALTTLEPVLSSVVKVD